MTSPSHDELIQRTAKRVGLPTVQVERIIDTYADEYIQLERKLRVAAGERVQRETTVTTEFAAPALPAEQPVTPRKRSAKVTGAAKPSDAQAEDQT